MWPTQPADAEPPLTREARAHMPFARLLLIYLDPFALFKDASRGSEALRRHALRYNRRMRWMLLAYLRRWGAIAAGAFLALLPAEVLAAQAAFFQIPRAVLAVGGCVALTVLITTAVAYVMLGRAE